MALPVPALVGVVDTNVLASQACRAVRQRQSGDGLLLGLAATGRSNLYVAAHVPGELTEHLRDVAATTKVDLAVAEDLLWNEIMPDMRIVDVAIRDCLSYSVRQFMRDGLYLSSMRGDVDDIQTVAVAELLAPSVIISADSVFARLGMANSVASWIGTARSLLRAAGWEATLADATLAVELAARLLLLGGGALARLVKRHPIWTTAILAGAVLLGLRLGYFDRARLRRGLAWLQDTAKPVLEEIRRGERSWDDSRRTLFVIEPRYRPTVEQVAARYLARCGNALTPSELRDELCSTDQSLTAALLRNTMRAHPAFLRHPGDVYAVGYAL